MREAIELMRGIPAEDHVISEEYVDIVRLYDAPNRHAVSLVLHRAYRRAAERADLAAQQPGWVRWRQSLQGTE